MTLTELHRIVGLHEFIEIHYVVDGYEAHFMTDDGNVFEHFEKGITIEEALTKLNTWAKEVRR